jgi:hypothetical protein
MFEKLDPLPILGLRKNYLTHHRQGCGRSVQCHSERRWDELPQAAAVGSRLFAPNFLLASIL